MRDDAANLGIGARRRVNQQDIIVAEKPNDLARGPPACRGNEAQLRTVVLLSLFAPLVPTPEATLRIGIDDCHGMGRCRPGDGKMGGKRRLAGAPLLCAMTMVVARRRFLGTERFAPPHFRQAPAAARRNVVLDVDQDNFALAVMIFQLLNGGLHPYQGQLRSGKAFPTDDVQTRIFAVSFPHGWTPDRRQKPSPFSRHDFFADETRTLFEQSFLGSARPNASLWRAHLDHLITIATPCPQEKSHLDFGKGCLICARERRVLRRGATSFNGVAMPTVARLSRLWSPIVAYAMMRGYGFGKAAGGITGVLFLMLIGVVGEHNRREPAMGFKHAVEGVRPRSSDVVASTSSRADYQTRIASDELPSGGGEVEPLRAPALAGVTAAPAMQPPVVLDRAEVTATRRLNVREGPSGAARVLETVEAGTRLQVVGVTENADWLAIERKGSVSYVFRTFTTPPERR
jgi:hypothetical protein